MPNKDFTPYAVVPKPAKMSKSLEDMYQAWVIQNQIPISNDYNMRAYFVDMLSGKAPPPEINAADKQLHFPDMYKLPNHPSFSNESMYSYSSNDPRWVENPAPYKEGTWALQNKKGNLMVEIPQD